MNLWQNLLYGDARTQAKQNQAYIINIYSMIALLAATIFGALHFLNTFVDVNTTVGAIELSVGGVVLLNMIGLRLHHNVDFARSVLLVSVMVLLEVLLISGGTQKTGAFWLFAFPVATFFLSGKKQGKLWVGALYFLIISTAVGDRLSLITTPYSLREIYQLLISLTVVTLGVYIYQGAREAALHEAEESRRDLQDYLDHMTTYSIKVGVDGIILFANNVAKEASGLGDHMLGTKFLDGRAWTTNEEARKRTEAAFHEAVAGKSISYDEQIRAASAGGYQTLTVNFSLIPIFNNERIAYILVEARDVTTEREANRTKAEFTAIATQQLKPSVTAIAAATEDLRKSLPEKLTDEQHESFQQISRHTQYISSSVSNMMLVSGLELENLPVNPQKLSITDLCQSVIEAMRIVHLKDRALEIGEDYAENLPEMPLDFELMRTILHNLISNSIKFTPDSGHINVRISQTEQKLAEGSKGSVQIEVQDSGHGIPIDEQKMIFTKFFHAKNTKEQSSGSGQGLYITKKLLDYVGGRISFSSKENVGTIFTVLLPLEGMEAHEQKSI